MGRQGSSGGPFEVVLTMPNDPSPVARVPLWAAYFAVGIAALVVHALLETGSMAQNSFYDIVGGSAVLVAFVGIARNRPDRRLPWVLMAIGQGLFVAGDVLWNWYEAIGEDPFPSMADALYLAGYPFIALGLLLLIRRRLGDGDRGGILDAAILTTACAILSWTFLIQPQLVGSELDALSLAISLAYPVADLLLIGVAMGLLTTPGARTSAFRMLAVSLIALLVADQIYALQNLEGTYVSGGPLDYIYLIAYILFGVSVAHPSMRRLTDPHPVSVTWLGPVRLVCLAAAMVTGPILVTFGPGADGGLAIIAAGTALLSLLVLARLYGLVGLLARDVAKRTALEDQLSYQAFHDPVDRPGQPTPLRRAGRCRAGGSRPAGLHRRPVPRPRRLQDRQRQPRPRRRRRAPGGGGGADPRGRPLRGPGRASRRRRVRGPADGHRRRRGTRPASPSACSRRSRRRSRSPTPRSRSSASIGIAIDSPAMVGVDDLLGDADVAMYQAKALGKGRHHVFTGSPAGASARERSWSEHPRTVRRPSIGTASLEPGAG